MLKRKRRRSSLYLAPGEVDPATPEARLKLTRRLVASAIRRYEAALEAARWMDSAYRLLGSPADDHDEDTKAERRAWVRLSDQYDDDFNCAELALASRIQNLYDELAPAGKRVGPGPRDHFTERAVRYRGTTYALQYSVEDYEPGSCIIAIVRDGRLIDLE
jgi:hypothetical protein